MIQGGDILNRGGKGGESIYGPTFKDEGNDLKHDQPFLVTMANKGPDTNSSQFFITTAPAPHLDGRHVIVGKIVRGTEYILQIENIAVDGRYRPLSRIVIEKCGELKLVKVKKDKSYRSSEKSPPQRKRSSIKRDREEILDPGVLPPPEVMDTRPNWLDRTVPYDAFVNKSRTTARRLIPWDAGYISPTKSDKDANSPVSPKSPPNHKKRRADDRRGLDRP